jgi:hypothetical protein
MFSTMSLKPAIAVLALTLCSHGADATPLAATRALKQSAIDLAQLVRAGCGGGIHGGGTAVAAGAALGMVSAATAWAGPAPGPNMCWYYTDQTRQQGCWDVDQ